MSNLSPPDPTEALAARPWTRLLERALGEARSVPTMLSIDEQKLYFWLASMWVQGKGEIVDLGCFVGGSTARLAEGHRVAGHTSSIHAYDRFTADQEAKTAVLYPQGINAFEGDDILPLAKELLDPWNSSIAFHCGEIDEMLWDDGPIELLVMDASKSVVTGDAMAEIFYPHLIAGESLIVQQDYFHWSQPWVAAQMEVLASFFRPVAHAPRDTLVFLCERVPEPAALKGASLRDSSDDDLFQALEAAEQRLEPLGLAPKLTEMREALAANPGRRKAHQFVRP